MSPVVAQREPYDIAIVGGGFSGIMVAINAARETRGRARIALIERKDEFGQGVAFASTPRDALLNVPASAMGALPDQPGDFVRWLQSLDRRGAPGVDSSAYYPRHLYGRYLASLLAEAEREGLDITCLCANVVDLERGPAGFRIIAHDGRLVAVGRQVVLAVGGPPPADIVDGMGVLRDHPRYVRDPWIFLKRHDFDAVGDILIVGSGLTALDVITAFGKNTLTNHLYVVSRRGRFPMPHAPVSGPLIDPIPAGAMPRTTREIVAFVRAALRDAAASGADWRTVIDGLRPGIQRLWIGLDLVERRRFLRHVRAIYDPHRHRAPQSQIDIKEELIARGRLSTIAGRILSLRAVPGALEAMILRRGELAPQVMLAAQIVNCGGPGNNYASGAHPFVANLLRKRDVAADTTGLGLSALPDGRLRDADGLPQTDLYTIGWPMRGVLLETTAVRELRVQARLLAATLVASAPSLSTAEAHSTSHA